MSSVKKNFSSALKQQDNYIVDSFIDDSIKIDKVKISRILSEYIDNKIILLSQLKARKFYVSISDGYDINISIDKFKLSGEIIGETIFYPYVAQSTKKIYIIVASKFNIYDHLNREPYMESKGEYGFQKNLARALGLTNATAYKDLKTFDNEDHIVNSDSRLSYVWDKKFSYLIFNL